MNVASLELCKELYELSSWGYVPLSERVDKQWVLSPRFSRGPNEDWQPCVLPYEYKGRKTHIAPAYDLGYLVRKLAGIDEPGYPANIFVEVTVLQNYASARAIRGITETGFDQRRQPNLPDCDADTPEDAAAKLAIELFKNGILKKEET